MSEQTYWAVEWWDAEEDARYLDVFTSPEELGEYMRTNAGDMHRARVAQLSTSTVAEQGVALAFEP